MSIGPSQSDRIIFVLLFLACCIQTSSHADLGVDLTARKPNILMILVDDLGFSDLGAYGSEISTPYIDTLAQQSIKFTNAHTYPSCAPTRSALITGLDPHRVGFGSQNNFTPPGVPAGTPGYSGSLEGEYTSIATLLKDAGYNTFQVGKWHLGAGPEQTPAALGFDRSFALLDGAASHYSDMLAVSLGTSPTGKASYLEDGVPLTSLPEDFYSTQFYTKKTIEMIGSQRESNKPFFGYLAYTAVHDPLHAPQSSKKNRAIYCRKSLESLRERRVEKLLSSPPIEGLDTTVKLAWVPGQARISELTDVDFDDLSYRMAVYAAMVEYLDLAIGEIVSYLKSIDEYENTLLVFMSDNGASAASRLVYLVGPEDRAWQESAYPLTRLEDYGKPGSFPTLGWPNALASSGPYAGFKGTVSEGGVRVPMLLKAPGESRPRVTNVFTHVANLYTTFANYGGIDEPPVEGLIGSSLKPFVEGRSDHVSQQGFGIEFMGQRAYYSGQWKLAFVPSAVGGTGKYALFDLSADPGETQDLSAELPEVVATLSDGWSQYARDNGVVPVPFEPVNRMFEQVAKAIFSLD